jgi:potassium/hydrogen antiporter
MDTSLVVLYLGCFYFLSHFFSWIFRKSRFPDVLLLILLGLLLGPALLGIASPEDFGKVGPVMTTVALTVILFQSGTDLKLRKIRDAAGATLAIGLMTFLMTIAVTSGIALAYGLPLLQSLLLGSILGGTSAAVVIPLVDSLGMNEAPKTILVLESAITDVLCIILSFSLIQTMESGTVEVGSMVLGIGTSLGVAALLGIAAGILWIQAWKLVHEFPNSTFSTIAYAFVVYGVVDSLGYSGAIGALTLGLTIANSKEFGAKESPLSGTERSFYSEIVFLLKTFFFVYLGICMELSEPLLVGLALIMILVVYGGRLGLTRLMVNKTFQRSDAILISVMIPKGLAAAVLASIPVQKGLEYGAEVQAVTFAGVFISILLTAVMIPLLRNRGVASFYDGILSVFPVTPNLEAGGLSTLSEEVSSSGSSEGDGSAPQSATWEKEVQLQAPATFANEALDVESEQEDSPSGDIPSS